MIIIYVGGIGSGKTVSAVRDIMNSKSFPYTGFGLKHIKHHRLRFEDIITSETNKQGKLFPVDVNWEFWKSARKEHENFSIYLDEAHNIISSRNSMSKRNKLFSNWISQIRKILYSSENNHIHIISQTARKLDVNFKELCHIFVECKSITIGKKVIVKQKFYDGEENFIYKNASAKRAFLANPYFKYYDTHEIDEMGGGVEYV